MLMPVFYQLKTTDTSSDFAEKSTKMVVTTVIICCLTRLHALHELQAENVVTLLQQFVLEPDVKKEVCTHYEKIKSILSTQQSR